jgi:hypothetical protein
MAGPLTARLYSLLLYPHIGTGLKITMSGEGSGTGMSIHAHAFKGSLFVLLRPPPLHNMSVPAIPVPPNRLLRDVHGIVPTALGQAVRDHRLSLILTVTALP